MDDMEYMRTKTKAKANPRMTADREVQDPGRVPRESMTSSREDEAWVCLG